MHSTCALGTFGRDKTVCQSNPLGHLEAWNFWKLGWLIHQKQIYMCHRTPVEYKSGLLLNIEGEDPLCCYVANLYLILIWQRKLNEARAWQAWGLRLAASILRNSECVVLGIRFIRWLWAQPLPDLAIKQYLQSCTDNYVGPGGFSTATTGILENHVSGVAISCYPTADIASRCHENLNCSAFAKDRYW